MNNNYLKKRGLSLKYDFIMKFLTEIISYIEKEKTNETLEVVLTNPKFSKYLNALISYVKNETLGNDNEKELKKIIARVITKESLANKKETLDFLREQKNLLNKFGNKNKIFQLFFGFTIYEIIIIFFIVIFIWK